MLMKPQLSTGACTLSSKTLKPLTGELSIIDLNITDYDVMFC